LLLIQDLEMSGKRLGPEEKAQITQLTAKVPPPIFAHYERMRDRGKKAVAIVRKSVCAACHMTLPVGTIMVLQRGDEIQLCGNCGRYLFLEITVEADPASAAALAGAPPAPRKRRPKSPGKTGKG